MSELDISQERFLAQENTRREFQAYLLEDIPYETCYVEENQVLIERNSLEACVYIVVSGVALAKKENVPLQFFGRYACLGIENIFSPDKTDTTILALTRMKVYKLTIKDVFTRLQQHGDGFRLLGMIQADHIDTFLQHHVASKLSHDRVWDVLLRLSFLYGKEENQCIYTPKYFSKKMIADYLNISYGSVAAAFRALEAEGKLHDEPHGMVIYKVWTQKVRKNIANTLNS
ncbi:Crp/Fnr family transcriptional regulator [Listeria booriae]|uniref:Cyclic nucleotide-binding domain-containing protein n=1 Tax=Listeria booriae TaxID=1552123 RepID=A0A099VZS7_9LIST|nr:Crp/Fnr family transcriptional regulator [Listeria booriae]KGL37936.1 hypothetical protein EP57_15370 [Listeria booriae]STY45933.1 Uncharacterised protein [Listeria booriae]